RWSREPAVVRSLGCVPGGRGLRGRLVCVAQCLDPLAYVILDRRIRRCGVEMAIPATADVLSTSQERVRASSIRTWARRIGRITESKPAAIGACIILFWIAAALLAPAIAPYPPNATSLAALAHPTPSAAHWLGTDQLGRDILSRILWGARTVLLVAPVAVLGAAILGSLLGLTAGYYRGVIDLVIARACDIVLSFPVIILYMIILAHVGSSAWNIIAVLTVT